MNSSPGWLSFLLAPELWQPPSKASPTSRVIRVGGVILFAVLAAWLFSPALTATHVEAFSARLETMALMDMHGKLALDDQAYPVNITYFYGTRPGTVLALEGLMRLTGSTGDINFRILILLSYVLLVAACLIFVRRWTEAPLWSALIFLVLTPGLVEISFFFSDNLASAALAMMGMALVRRRTALWIWPLIGVLLAASILLRLDGLFAIPSVMIVALMRDDLKWKRLAADALATICGASALFYLSWRVTTVSLWQALRIGSWFAKIHASWHSPLHYVLFSLLFFGLPCLMLLFVGSWKNLRTRGIRWNLCLTIYPGLLYMYFATKAVDQRDFLLLGAPFLLLQGSVGATAIARTARSSIRRRRLVAQAALAAIAISLVAPPLVVMEDGPRTPIGRIWSPSLWRGWQSSIKGDLAECDAIIDSAQPNERILVVSSLFQADRYLHLRLLQKGYEIEPSSTATTFGSIAEVYKKGRRTFLHVRTEHPYGILEPLPYTYVQEYQLAKGLSAMTPADYDRAVLLTWGGSETYQRWIGETPEFRRESGPMLTYFPANPATPRLRRAHYGKLRTIPLSRRDVAELEAFGNGKVEKFQSSGSSRPLHDYAELHQKMAGPFWHP